MLLCLLGANYLPACGTRVAKKKHACEQQWGAHPCNLISPFVIRPEENTKAKLATC